MIHDGRVSMNHNDLITHTGCPASIPDPTCHANSFLETAKSPSECPISEQCIGYCQLIAHVISPFTTALCILFALVVTAIVACAILYRLSRDQASGKAIASGASPSIRGKNSNIGGVASGSSNAVRARAQSTSTHADANPPLGAHESRSDEIDKIVADDITHLEGSTQSVHVSGPRRGASNALHQAAPPTTDRARFFFQTGFYRSIASVVGQFTDAAVRYRLIPRSGNPPLLHSLHGCDPTFSIFAIAGDDTERDIEALRQALTGPYRGNARFVSFDRDVALENIEAEIKKLCDQCRGLPDTHLFIYLTGHGNQRNNMYISQSEDISAKHLFDLLSANRPTIPVTILFDICRQAEIQSAAPPSGISLIWACSLEETAGACRVPDCDGPDSCFLIALMMSARTPSLQYTSEALKRVVQERLDQLMDYLEEVYIMKHSAVDAPGDSKTPDSDGGIEKAAAEHSRPATMGRCNRCSDTPEPCYKPERQNIDWENAGDLDGLLELTRILSSSAIAEDIYQWFMGDDIFLRVNKLSDSRGSPPMGEARKARLPVVMANIPSPVLVISHLPEDHTSKHERGANEPIVVG